MPLSNKTSQSTSPRRHIVSFELDDTAFRALQVDAALRGVTSLHQRAREIIIDALCNRDVVELRQVVAELDEKITFQAELQRRLAYILMVDAAGISVEDANEWIRKHMFALPKNRT